MSLGLLCRRRISAVSKTSSPNVIVTMLLRVSSAGMIHHNVNGPNGSSNEDGLLLINPVALNKPASAAVIHHQHHQYNNNNNNGQYLLLVRLPSPALVQQQQQHNRPSIRFYGNSEKNHSLKKSAQSSCETGPYLYKRPLFQTPIMAVKPKNGIKVTRRRL